MRPVDSRFISWPRWITFCVALGAGRLVAANFVAAEALDYAALIGEPPAMGSAVARAELETLVEWQGRRTAAEERRANEIERETLWGFGADAVGSWFQADRLPKTAALFARVREDFIAVNRVAKAQWPRRRPPFVDARIRPCVETTDSGSYPSGHGIQSSLWAGLLAELMPAHAPKLAARAAETRRMKLWSGVHYPSDIIAGQVVGEALARAMLASPQFQKEAAEVKEELAAAAAAAGAKGY